MKKIEDYLHLYIGCEIICPFDLNKVEKIEGVCYESGLLTTRGENYTTTRIFGEAKLILRPLSDMTEEEHDILVQINPDLLPLFPFVNTSASHEFLWALKQGFDLFGLIEDGLATIKK